MKKKAVRAIFMAIIIGAMTLTSAHAHVPEEISPLATQFCPRCGALNYEVTCGSSTGNFWTERCGTNSSCTVRYTQYSTNAHCGSCDFTPGGYSPYTTHNHTTHTVCNPVNEGACPIASEV